MELFQLSRVICFVIISAITLWLNIGCSRKDNIVSDKSVDTGPNISITIDRNSDQSGFENPIEATLHVNGAPAKIERIIYSISGQTCLTDTLFFSPGMVELSETIYLPNDLGLNQDSSLTIKVIAIDEYGLSSLFKHSFNPIDVLAPTISISYNASHGYAPKDTVTLHITASDNTALYYIAVSTAGAFAWDDTLKFEEPYPTEIDTFISVPIPVTTYLDFEFWITAEAVDVNFNSSMASQEEHITIVFESGPVVEVHPVGGSNWVQRGDTLRFWVVGYNNTPLKSLGYWLQYGWDAVRPTIDFRDSLSGDFNCIDSAYFAYYVPDIGYCRNTVCISPFAYNDYSGSYSSMMGYFVVENRIRFSQATVFTVPYPNDVYALMLIDDRRDLVYVGSCSDKSWVNVYSQTSRQFLDPIDILPLAIGFCLSSDTNSILVLHREPPAVSIIDINSSSPHIDTIISLPAPPHDITALSDGTALITAFFENVPWPLLRLNLDDFHLDYIELKTGNAIEVIASGNSEYALIAATSDNTQLYLYQAHIGIIATTSIDDGENFIAANHDGSRFLTLNVPTNHTYIFDRNLSLIDSISWFECHRTVHSGAFSRDDLDLYITSGWDYIAHYSTEDWVLEGGYNIHPFTYLWQDLVDIATNAAGDRLFVTGYRHLETFFFWDIPIDPR